MPALSQCALNAKILAAESICAVERSFILASNSKYFQMMLAQTCVTVLGLSLGLERDCLFRNTRIRVQTHTCSHTHTHIHTHTHTHTVTHPPPYFSIHLQSPPFCTCKSFVGIQQTDKEAKFSQFQ